MELFISDVLNYLEETFSDLDVFHDSFGLIDHNQYVCLAKSKDVKDQLIVVIDMNEPKRVVLLAVVDAFTYWSARYMLAFKERNRNE